MSRKTLERLLASLFLYMVGGTIVLLLLGNLLLVYQSSGISKSDVIIILGFPAQEDGNPSETMKSRVDKGVELLEAGYAPRMIVTGASVGNRFVEADVMANYARSRGVNAGLIIEEPLAQDTIQNARNSVRIMLENNWTSAIVVTSPYHTRRAYQLFLQYDLKQLTMVSARPVEELNPMQRILDVLHEYAAYAWYFVARVNTK